MTLSRGFRGDAGNVRRAAVRVVAAVLVGAAMSAAIWAGPAAAARGSREQSRASASPSPARVKYYIVPKARNGVAPSLYAIAAGTLGDGNLFTEIFNLNKGRLQPDGGRLENPQQILVGWILELPADASGPGVHFGRLPGTSPPPAAPVSPQPSRPAPDGPAAHRSPVSWADAGGVIVIVVVVAGLAVGLRRRRAAGAVRRKPTHARGSGPRPSARTGPAATAAPSIRAADSSWPGAGHPNWPEADHPSFPGAGHPSFPGADHPSFPGADPSWSAADYPDWPQAASLSAVPGARYVTENLAIPARPAARPATRPGTKPAVKPADKPAHRLAAKPSATRPAAKPGGPPRQYAAMRLTRAVTAALLLFAVIAGTTELGLHGYSFFVFRAAGTGSTPGNGVKEDQGPGQPDAPGAHQRPAGHKP